MNGIPLFKDSEKFQINWISGLVSKYCFLWLGRAKNYKNRAVWSIILLVLSATTSYFWTKIKVSANGNEAYTVFSSTLA